VKRSEETKGRVLAALAGLCGDGEPHDWRAVSEATGLHEGVVRDCLAQLAADGRVERVGTGAGVVGKPGRRPIVYRVAVLAALAAFAASVLAGCQMTPEQRIANNERAHATAEQNMRAGLPMATVWCYEPASGGPNDVNRVGDVETNVWVVTSHTLAEHGWDCDAATLGNPDGIRTDGTFTYVGDAV
jgi:hypothetical protein